MAYGAQQPTRLKTRVGVWVVFLFALGLGCTQPTIIPPPDQEDGERPESAARRLRDGGPVYGPEPTPCWHARDCGKKELCLEGKCTPEPYCGDGIQGQNEQCDDGNDDTSDGCVKCRIASCPDGYIRDEHEECEVGVGGRTGWTHSNCDLHTCTRKAYNACYTNLRACPRSTVCYRGVCTPLVCPVGALECEGYATQCVQIPSHRTRTVEKEMCFLECDDESPCPAGLACAPDGVCVGEDDESLDTVQDPSITTVE